MQSLEGKYAPVAGTQVLRDDWITRKVEELREDSCRDRPRRCGSKLLFELG
jgi:hypothetical protein